MEDKDGKVDQKVEEKNSMLKRSIDELNKTLKEKDKLLMKNDIELGNIMNPKELEANDICNDASYSFKNNLVNQTYNEEIRKLQCNAIDHLQRINNENEKLKSELECQRKELELCREEVKKHEKKTLKREKRKNSIQMKADEDVLLLANHLIMGIHKRIVQLQINLNTEQTFMLQRVIKRLITIFNELNYIGFVHVAHKERIKEMSKKLKDKKEQLKGLEDLNKTLILQERKSNDELLETLDEMQEAHEELISGMMEIFPNNALIGVKRMGELDARPFQAAACKRKICGKEGDVKAMEIFTSWKEHIQNPDWQPFKIIKVGNLHQEIIDEDDEMLTALRNEMSDEVYKAVTTALVEMNEYNPIDRDIISELWNYKDERRASLKEGISYILKQLKIHKGIH